MNKLKYFLIFLFFDFLISNIFLKNTSYWNISEWDKKYWRIPSEVYHHGILPNIDKIEKWGGNIQKRIITNSIGFIDKENRKVIKDNPSKKRILLIGDSFIEGSGLDYKDTFAGLLSAHLGQEYEILNSALGSYSPSIYFKKTKYFIDQGFKFDEALIFLDVSDIFDELFIKFDENENILTHKQTKKRGFAKTSFYAVGRILRDNTITFRFFNILSDKTELLKNYIKLKIKASKELNTSFFNVSKDEVMFYRMTHIDRGFWTYNDKKFSEIELGLKQADKYLEKLFELLEANNIKSTLIVYPWPTQIVYGDKYHENYWSEFSRSRKINFLSMYKYFQTEDKKKFIFKNFLYGDIHWNKNGTQIIFKNVIENLNF